MHLIIGLGNPGREYELTRHNLGFLVADELAASARSAFRPGKGEYWLAQCSLNESAFIVLKPVTYMNNSGIAVEEFLQQEEISLEHILVVCDDFQLPLGTLRLRPGGSDGGHNGLASIIYHLQTDQFPRLRCGIGSEAMPAEKPMIVNFVLDSFTKAELPVVKRMVNRAREATLAFVEDGIGGAMNRFNGPPTENTTIT
jgi:PTH1 family peptidyl-tRNA hydrolase